MQISSEDCQSATKTAIKLDNVVKFLRDCGILLYPPVKNNLITSTGIKATAKQWKRKFNQISLTLARCRCKDQGLKVKMELSLVQKLAR